MQEITISLSDEVASRTEQLASQRGLTVSELIAELLCKRLPVDETYEEAMHAFLAQPSRTLSNAPGTYPSRESLHER